MRRFDLRELWPDLPGDLAEVSAEGAGLPLASALAFSPDGAELFVGVGHWIAVLDLAAGRWRGSIPLFPPEDAPKPPWEGGDHERRRVREIRHQPEFQALMAQVLLDPPPGDAGAHAALLLDAGTGARRAARCERAPGALIDAHALAAASAAPVMAVAEADPAEERNAVVVLDTRSGEPLEEIPYLTGGAWALALSPDAGVVAAAAAGISIYDRRTSVMREVDASLTSRWARLRFSADGATLYAATPADYPRIKRGYALAIDAQAAEIRAAVEIARGLYPLGIARDGTCAFAAMKPIDRSLWGDDELVPARTILDVTFVHPDRPAARRWTSPRSEEPSVLLAVDDEGERVAWVSRAVVHVARVPGA